VSDLTLCGKYCHRGEQGVTSNIILIGEDESAEDVRDFMHVYTMDGELVKKVELPKSFGPSKTRATVAGEEIFTVTMGRGDNGNGDDDGVDTASIRVYR
jgi:hypothetical protein